MKNTIISLLFLFNLSFAVNVHSQDSLWSKLNKKIIECNRLNKFDESLIHALNAAQIAEKNKQQNPSDYAFSLDNLAFVYEKINRFADAEDNYKKSLNFKLRFNLSDKEILNSWINLAGFYYFAGRYKEAEELFLKAIDKIKNSSGDNETTICFLMSNLAVISEAMKNYSKAEELFNASYNTWEQKGFQKDLKYSFILACFANYYYGQNKYVEAEQKYNEALKIREKLLGPNHFSLASLYNNLADLLESQLKYDKAQDYYEKALYIRERSLGKGNKEVANSLDNLASLNDFQGMYDNAKILYIKSKVIREKNLSSNDIRYASSISNLASIHSFLGEYNESKPLYKKSLEITESITGSGSQDVAITLNNIGNLFYNQAEYDSAKTYYERAYEIKTKIFGEDGIELVPVLNNLANLSQVYGKYDEAEELLVRALEIRQKKLGGEHLKTASSLNGLANLYVMQGKYSEAEKLYNQALKVREALLGKTHNEIAASKNNLSVLYYKLGRYDEAEDLLKQALEIRETALDKDNPEVASTLNNLAALYDHRGIFDRADSLYRRALRIREKSLGLNHPDLISTINNLANLYNTQGRYSEAEPLWKRALDISERTLGKDHLNLTVILSNMATLYFAVGKTDQVEPLLKRVLEIREKKLGKDDIFISSALNNLAAYYFSVGKTELAEPMIKRCLEIRSKVIGESHPYYANSLENLAEIYHKQGKDSDAETLFKEALKTKEKLLGPEHFEVASTLNSLGSLYYDMAKYFLAHPYYERALKIYERALGPKHPYVTQTLKYLAKNYSMRNLPNEAEKYFDLALTNIEDQYKQLFTFLSEKEKITFLNKINDHFSAYYSFAYKNYQEKPAIVEKMFNLLLWQKGLVATGTSEIFRNIQNSNDNTIQKLFDSLKVKREILAKLYSSTPDNVKDLLKQIKIFESESNEIEKELTKRSPEFANSKKKESVTWKDVANILGPDEAVVEFVGFQFSQSKESSSNLYGALVINGKTKDKVSFEPIADEDSLKYVLGMSYESSIDDFPIKSAISKNNLHFRTIWDPLEKDLVDTKRIFLCPDGVFNQVSFNTFVNGEDKFLLDKYEIRYLTSSKDLIKIDDRASKGENVFLFGDPNYSYKENINNQKSSEETSSSGGLGLLNIDLQKNPLEQLPQTRLEIDSISSLLISKNRKPFVYLGDSATENSIKKISSARLLHIATHGGFLPEPSNSGNIEDYKEGKYDNMHQYINVDNPMMRSMLFFAGANIKSQKSEDGIFTAYETSNLDLSKTELVVLSACQTGQGEVKMGEGVFGLRRAFQIAGAEAIIMSLWKVPDEETREMMILFYKNWLEGKDKYSAFQIAQREMRQIVKQRYNGDRPYYWGAFVIVGK